MRSAIKIYANNIKHILKQDLDSNHIEIKINDILHTANEASDIKKLQECYNKIKYTTSREEAYMEEFAECKDEIVKSVDDIIQHLFECDNKVDLFKKCKKDKFEIYTKLQNFQKDINETESYKKMASSYKQLKAFATDIILSWNKICYYKQDHLGLPKLIDEKEIEARLIEAANPPTNNNNVSIDEILNEIFESGIVEIGSTDLLMPRIIDYNDYHKFTDKDLITTPNDIETSIFFKSLLNITNKLASGIRDVYERTKNSRGYLTKAQEEFNKRIKNTITKTFNKIYGKSKNDLYRFDIKLDKDEISLSIFKGDDVVVLNDQSAGFKWFFNLYFNLLNSKTLKQGDIVLMDEPAHNLSPKARKECADLLRKYGEENGITFVIITHDIFWVNMDYLNELRVIQNRKDKALKGVHIKNDFSRINSSDTDTLLTIKRAFGVTEHVFYPPNARIIFVEGITDYNYLTTFKLLWQKENNKPLNICFLPICGLGKEGEREIVLEKLMDQSKNPILLMDSDIAKNIKKIKDDKKYEKLEIIEIDEIDSNFKKEIENLFNKDDIEKYGLKVKGNFVSASFKKHMLWNNGQINDATKKNFYKVLEYLNKDI